MTPGVLVKLNSKVGPVLLLWENGVDTFIETDRIDTILWLGCEYDSMGLCLLSLKDGSYACGSIAHNDLVFI